MRNPDEFWMRCKTGAFRTVYERLPSSLLQYAETDHAQRGQNTAQHPSHLVAEQHRDVGDHDTGQ